MPGTNPRVIDLSHYQNEPDFFRLKAAGTIGVILKATQGSSYIDPTFTQRRTNARSASMPTVAYHFLEPGNVASQVSFFLKVAQPGAGERVVIDYEASDGNEPSLADLEAMVSALQKDARRLQVTVYGGNLLKQKLGSAQKSDILASTSLWLAQYPAGGLDDRDKITWPKQVWPTWSLWQYTDKGYSTGLTGTSDCNVFNGSDENLYKWISPAVSRPNSAAAAAGGGAVAGDSAAPSTPQTQSPAPVTQPPAAVTIPSEPLPKVSINMSSPIAIELEIGVSSNIKVTINSAI